jgi:hypothetical protein
MTDVTSILNSAGRITYQLAFQISPIIFTQGIAGNLFGMLPIAVLTDEFAILNQAISGAISGTTALPNSLDDFFAHFTPVPGGKIANFAVGQYPFANQSVAANAIIAEPLTVSLRMSIPVRGAGGYFSKFLTMLNLQKAVQKHSLLGGTYTIMTPAYIYSNCLLTGLTDISQGNSPVPQNTWQWDFVQPLVTLQQAQDAAQQNTQMTQISSGVETSGGLNAPGASGAIPNTVSQFLPLGNLIPPSITGTVLGGT